MPGPSRQPGEQSTESVESYIKLEKAEGSRHQTGREEGQACHDCHYFSLSASTNENSEKDETLWEYALTLLASIETVIESI